MLVSITTDHEGSGTVPNSRYGAVLGSRSTRIALVDSRIERADRGQSATKYVNRDPRTVPYLELGTVPEPPWSVVMDPGS